MIVIGTRPPELPTFPSDPDPEDPYPGDGDTGGGGDTDTDNEPTPPEPPPPICQATAAFVVKNYSDALAVEASRQILGNVDHRRIEYGAIVYRDGGGTIRLSELVRGQPGSIPGFPADVLRALTLPGSAVLGIIHNHPTDYFESEGERVANRNPSENDWEVAEALVGLGASPDLLQMYIVGPDDVIREFEFTKRDTYKYTRKAKFSRLVTGEVLNKNMLLPNCEVMP